MDTFVGVYLLKISINIKLQDIIVSNLFNLTNVDTHISIIGYVPVLSYKA